MHCLLNDPTKCKPLASIAIEGERGIVQINCQACGHGCSEVVSKQTALELRAAKEEGERAAAAAENDGPKSKAQSPKSKGR